MVVETLTLGPYQTNCYLLHDHNSVWVIDPAFAGGTILQRIQAKKLHVEAVILTHSHWDHLMGLPELVAAHPEVAIYVHPHEAQFLGKEGGRRLRKLAISIDPSQARFPLSFWESLPEPTHFLQEGETIPGCSLQVLHTPGHTAGSVSLYLFGDDILFSGDTLFAGSIGRTDLPNSDPQAIIPGIKTKLLTLPKKTIVYPGHGPATTIEKEMSNPWLA